MNDEPKFMMRLPSSLHVQIKEIAKANGRSMNAELIWRLKESLGIDPLTADPDSKSVVEQMAEDIKALRAMAEQFMQGRSI